MTYSAEVLADSPLAYWRCGEASGNLADSSGNSRTLTATGSPTYSQTSLLASDSGNSAVSVATGSDYWSRSDATMATLTAAWSLEAWISPSGGFSEGAVVTTDYSGEVAWAMRTNGTRRIESAFYTGSWRSAASSFDLSIGVTYHVVCTWNGTDLKLYLDGVLDATSTPGSGLSSPTTSTVYLGRKWDGSTPFPGVIDEVAIYNSALSPSRIAAHFSAGSSSVIVGRQHNPRRAFRQVPTLSRAVR